MSQEPVLFNGTVFENIRNGLIGTPWEHESPEQQLLRVKDAARTAFAHDFIENLPQQYHTRIGERGGLLSGGQKQRVAIARSIISQPKVLLLDEATSALDPHAEAIVQKALDKASKNRTTIVIAHKLKTIQAADNIVVMAKGRIIEQGQHAELIARGAAYSNLVRAQDLSLREENSGSEPSHEDQNESIFEKSVSLGRQDTNTREELKLLSKREDYGLSPSNGILSNAVRLIRSTSDLKWWYVFSLISSVLGGKLLFCLCIHPLVANNSSWCISRTSAAAGQSHGHIHPRVESESWQLFRLDVLHHGNLSAVRLYGYGLDQQPHCSGKGGTPPLPEVTLRANYEVGLWP